MVRVTRRMVAGAAVAVVAVAVLCVAAALGAFRSDADRARDAVSSLLETYVVPVPDEEGEEPEDSPWPAADYGDAATIEALERFGVSADEWHRHCFAHFSFEVGEATAEGDAATVSVSVTNASLSSALDAAAADFGAWEPTQEAQEAYAQGGRAVLFDYLVERVYAHLDAGESMVTTSVDVPCSRGEDGTWSPQVAGSEGFFSALYGGSNVVAGLAATEE